MFIEDAIGYFLFVILMKTGTNPPSGWNNAGPGRIY